MSTQPEVDPDLIERYKAAVYRVRDANHCIAFRVDIENPDLDKLLDAHDVRTAAFITTHNPHSQVQSPADNDLAHGKLLEELRDRGFCWLSGEGVDAKNNWIPETSVMVFGIDSGSATGLARQFEQNAFIWIQGGKSPRLVLTQRCEKRQV